MARKPVRRKAVRKPKPRPKPRPKPTAVALNPSRAHAAVDQLCATQHERVRLVALACQKHGHSTASLPPPSVCLRRVSVKLDTLVNVARHCQPAFADAQSLMLYRHSLRVLLADAANYCAFLAAQLDRITEVVPDLGILSPKPSFDPSQL